MLQYMKNIIGIIPARSGSKGVKNKMIKDFSGKPLISWTIKAALKSKLLNKVIVDTNCKEIAGIAKKYGAEVPYLRPQELAQPETSMDEVLINAINVCENELNHRIDALVLLLPTNPMRNATLIDSCIEQTIHGKQS